MKRLIFLCALLLFVSIVFAGAVDVITFEANILASEETNDVVRVEVPNSIFLGNVSKGGKSNEVRVWMNNTGNVDIIVRPQLIDLSKEYFENLYFRDQKTKNKTDVPFERIGDFGFVIDKPLSGEDFRKEDFYAILDLTNYTGEIPNDLIGYKADVKFYAFAA